MQTENWLLAGFGYLVDASVYRLFAKDFETSDGLLRVVPNNLENLFYPMTDHSKYSVELIFDKQVLSP
jgi:hypothetical protein|tara:strand:+ start:563 stop:766 length:204 start_codon:yes stop_codon:yes gene_type:complete